MITHPAPELLSYEDAVARLGDSLRFEWDWLYDTIPLLDGDVVVEGDFLKAVTGIVEQEFDGVHITGNLTVNGPIALYETRPTLSVRGTTRAETLEGGDAEIYINGGVFTYLVYGYYNDGVLDTGAIDTPWVINSDHDLRVTAPGARHIDNFHFRGYLNDADIDFTTDEIADAFVPEVVSRERDAVDVHKFLERLRAGLPVLK
ncbi:hypothetical protein [Actinomadura spongiicola]|nr:hypothetical protein [Actinomadura spongiicola]